MVLKDKLPCPSKAMRIFSAKMLEAGFYEKDIRNIKLPSHSEYSGKDDGTMENVPFRVRLWRRMKSFFAKDELAGLKFPANWHVFNRNHKGEKSNFFVIARHTVFGGIEVMFSNPLGPEDIGKIDFKEFGYGDVGRTGTQLTRREIMLNLSCKLRGRLNIEQWCSNAAEFISHISAYKPYECLFADPHKHGGKTRGRSMMDERLDDGRSSEARIVANEIFRHSDFMPLTSHNSIYEPYFNDMNALAAAVGIVAVPGMEVTMPVRLYDDYTVETFVGRVNKHRDKLNALADGIRKRRGEIRMETESLEAQRAAFAMNVDRLESEIHCIERELSRLKGSDRKNSETMSKGKATTYMEITAELGSLEKKRIEHAARVDMLEKEIYEDERAIIKLKAQLDQKGLPSIEIRNFKYQMKQMKAEVERKTELRDAAKRGITALKSRIFAFEENLGENTPVSNENVKEQIRKKKEETAAKSRQRKEIKKQIKTVKIRIFELEGELAETGASDPEQLPEQLVLPPKFDGTYSASAVTRLIEKNEVVVRAFNALPGHAAFPIPFPVPEPNGPHITMYAGSMDAMREVVKKYLSNKTLDYPPFAHKIEMRDFLNVVGGERYWGAFGFGNAHPFCGSSLPKIGSYDRVAGLDITHREMEKLTMNHIQVCAAWNSTISDDEEAPLLQGIFETEKAELEAKYGKLKWTLNAGNLAVANFYRKRGISMMAEGDTHYFDAIDFGMKYCPNTLCHRTVLRAKGRGIERSPAGFVSALHDAKENGVAEIDAQIYIEKNEKKGILQIAEERAKQGIGQIAGKIWSEIKVYGISGVPYLIKDSFNLLFHEGFRPRTLKDWIHYSYAALKGGDRNKQNSAKIQK